MPSGYQQALSDMNRYGLDIILEIPENFEKASSETKASNCQSLQMP